MQPTSAVTRRTAMGRLVALAGVGLLAACGGGGPAAAPASSPAVSATTGATPSAAPTAASKPTTAPSPPAVPTPAATSTPIQRLATHAGNKGKLRIAYAGSVEELQMRQNQIDAWQKTQADWTVDVTQIVGNRYEWMEIAA